MYQIIVGPGFFRLILATLVFLHHVSSIALGEMAVIVFFVLSGYWIAKMYREKYSKKKNTIITFYVSRFLRVIPIFIVASIIHLTIFKILNIKFNIDYQSLSTYLILGYSFLDHRMIGPAWSLDLEVQFYLLFPLLIYLFKFKKLILVISIVLTFIFIDFQSGFLHNTFLFHYIFYFTAGSLAYLSNFSLDTKKVYISTFCFFVILIFLFINSSNYNVLIGGEEPSEFYVQYHRITVHILSLFLIPFALSTVKNLSNKFDRFLGNLSYPVYLIHWTPALIMSIKFTDLPYMDRLLYSIIVVILTYALCIIITLTVDRFFENLRKKILLNMN